MMSTATIFTSVAVAILAAAALSCLGLYGVEGIVSAGAAELDGARSAACLLTIF